MTIFKAILLGTALASASAPAFAQNLTTVNMINPLPRSTNFFPLVVAEALGYFAEEGVEYLLRGQGRRHRQVATGQAFGQAEEVRLHVFFVAREDRPF